MTEIEIWPDALRTWSRVAALLPRYWAAGKKLDGFDANNWQKELGVIVQGIPRNPSALLEFVLSADMAVEMLRKRHLKAYLLAVGTIEEPHRKWFRERGTGLAQCIGIGTMEEAKTLYAGALMHTHWLLEMDVADEPEDIATMLGDTRVLEAR